MSWLNVTEPSKTWTRLQPPLDFQVDRGVWMLPNPNGEWGFFARSQLALGIALSLDNSQAGWVDEINRSSTWVKKGVVT